MAIIALPGSARFRRVQWSLDRKAQVNRSAYTGARRVVANPWHGIWSAQVELAPIVGEANVRAWRGFLATLKGQINTFLLPATEGSQSGLSDTTVASGGAQGATTLVMAAARTVTAGMLATVTLPSANRQLVMITVDSAGTTLTFEPPLRESAAVSAAVALASPACLVALADSAFGWSVDPGTQYGITFNVEEAF